MARRGENIHQRKDGRWEARYQKGRRDDGSIEYGYVYAQKYADVKQKRSEIINSLRLPTDISKIDIEELTFNELFNRWRADVKGKIKDSSFAFYDVMMECHLRPHFGEMRVMQLTAMDTQDFINVKLSEDLSPAYVRSIFTLFANIIKTAQTQYQLPLQVPVFQLPKSSKKTPEIYSVKEWQCLVNYLKRQNDSFSFGLLLCMYTGIRIGELSGLRWEDYDPVNVQFKIRRTIYRIKNTTRTTDHSLAKTIVCEGPPKTSTSVRDIPLPYTLQEDIKKHCKAPETFVLTGSTNYMEPRNIQRKYKKILQQLGLRYINFHSLRHSFATLSIQSGCDYRTIAELLGHSSVNTTLNVYVHSGIDQKRNCLERLLN